MSCVDKAAIKAIGHFLMPREAPLVPDKLSFTLAELAAVSSDPLLTLIVFLSSTHL